MRTWKNIELTRTLAELLEAFLYENDIEFESSECYDLIHIEINVNEYEEDAINEYLDEITEHENNRIA